MAAYLLGNSGKTLAECCQQGALQSWLEKLTDMGGQPGDILWQQLENIVIITVYPGTYLMYQLFRMASCVKVTMYNNLRSGTAACSV